MIVKKCGYCISLKTGAFITSFCHIGAGGALVVISIAKLAHFHYIEIEGEIGKSFLVTWIAMGILNVLMGILLLISLLKGKEFYILLYLLLGLMNSIIVGVYTGINMYLDHSLIPFFIMSFFLWYILICMYGFFMEMRGYNTTDAGVIEISYNNGAQYVNKAMTLEKVEENTAV